MASYRFSAKVVSRGKGQNVVAKAAYNARENLRDERTGEMKRYADRPGLEWSGIFAPKDAPEWALTRAKLWNAVEAREDQNTRRDTAQLARSIELNFPHELNAEERRRLLRDFAREEFVRHGMIVDAAIHAPEAHGTRGSHGGGHGDGADAGPDESPENLNYHAHLLVTLRAVGPDGFGAKAREWNSTEQHLRWREKWAELGARYLKNAGHETEADHYRVGHHTLEKQREIAIQRGELAYAETLNRLPTLHLGPTAAAMLRRGADTERGNAYRDDLKYAKEETADRAALAELDRQIAQRRRDLAPPEHDPDPEPAPPPQQQIDPKPPPDVAPRHPNFEQQARAQEIAQAHARARKALTAALSAETERERPSDVFAQAKAEVTQPMRESALAQIKKYVVEHYLPELAKFRHNAPDFFLQIFTALHEVNDKVTERARELSALFTGNRETALATPKPPPPDPGDLIIKRTPKDQRHTRDR